STSLTLGQSRRPRRPRRRRRRCAGRRVLGRWFTRPRPKRPGLCRRRRPMPCPLPRGPRLARRPPGRMAEPAVSIQLLSADEVAARVEAVAGQIAPRIDDETVAVCLLTGGVWFAADLM